MLFRRIQNRLIAALLSVAAVPLVGIGFYSIHSNTVALRELARAGARERAHLKAERIEAMFGDIRNDLAFLARSPMLIGMLDASSGPENGAFWRQKLGQQFMVLAQNKAIYARLRFLDETGQEVVGAECDGLRAWLIPDKKLENRSMREYFRASVTLPAGEVFISAFNRSDEAAPEPVVRYVLRVADRRDRRRGMLVADVFARRIVQAVDQVGAFEQGQTALITDDGARISSAGTPDLLDTDLGAVRKRLLAGETAVLVEQDTATVSWAPVRPALPRTDPLWLLVEVAPKEAMFASVRRFQILFAGLIVVTVGAGMALSLWLARRIAGPLSALRQGARRIASGDLAHRLAVHTGDEIQEVAEEFNHMGDELQATYRQLQAREQEKTERLEAVSQQLVEREKLAAVGQLAAGVAHEVNNPVGVVSMFVQQLLERGDLPAVCREKLHIVERHVERIGRITRGLLDFARGRTDRREPVDLSRVLARTLAAFDPMLTRANIAVVTQFGSFSRAPLGDEEQVQQVFDNLTLNAIQAMPGGGRLTVEVAYGADEVLVRFADTGSGISEEHMSRVFDPFFTTKEVGQGTGLGLAVSFGIVKAHGGRLTVRNDAAGGAVFTVVLPLPKQTDATNSKSVDSICRDAF